MTAPATNDPAPDRRDPNRRINTRCPQQHWSQHGLGPCICEGKKHPDRRKRETMTDDVTNTRINELVIDVTNNSHKLQTQIDALRTDLGMLENWAHDGVNGNSRRILKLENKVIEHTKNEKWRDDRYDALAHLVGQLQTTLENITKPGGRLNWLEKTVVDLATERPTTPPPSTVNTDSKNVTVNLDAIADTQHTVCTHRSGFEAVLGSNLWDVKCATCHQPGRITWDRELQ